MSDMVALKERIAALEAKLGGRKADGDADETEETKLAAQIEALEKRLADDDGDDDEDDKACDAKKASEVDPNGVEEDITQKRFTEVEDLEHGTELATGPSMGAVAPTNSEYVAKMKKASARLDAVAEYLEKHGRRALAFRIDKIADVIDARIKGGK